MIVIKILLAIIFPPVAAFLQVGLSAHFWINLILSFFFWLPGMIHALWLIFTKKTA